MFPWSPQWGPGTYWTPSNIHGTGELKKQKKEGGYPRFLPVPSAHGPWGPDLNFLVSSPRCPPRNLLPRGSGPSTRIAHQLARRLGEQDLQSQRGAVISAVTLTAQREVAGGSALLGTTITAVLVRTQSRPIRSSVFCLLEVISGSAGKARKKSFIWNNKFFYKPQTPTNLQLINPQM